MTTHAPSVLATDALPRASAGLRRIAQISASLVGTHALTSVLGLLFWTIAARQFAVADVGVAGAAVAFMMLVGSLSTLGLGTLLIARLPHTDQGDRRLLVRTSLALAGSVGAVGAFAVAGVAVHALGLENVRPLAGAPLDAMGLSLGTALMAVVLVLDQAVLVLGSGRLQLERNAVASVGKVLALIALASAGATGGMSIFLAWTLGTAASLPLVAWRTRGGRELQTTRRLVDPMSLRGLGRSAASHHALNVALQAPLQVLPLLVTVVLSAEANGYFNAAVLVTGFVFALPYAMTIGLFAAAEGDESAALARMRVTIPAGLAVSVGAYAALFPLAGTVLSVFGSDYADQASGTLRLLVLAGLPFVVKDHFVALRRVQGRTTDATYVLVAFTVLEIAAAAAGAAAGGTTGLCAAWVGVLMVEAVVLGVPLLRAVRREGLLPAGGRPGELGSTGGATFTTGRTIFTTGLRHAASTWRLRLLGPAHAGVTDLTGPVLCLMSAGLLLIALAAAGARESASGSGDEALYVAGLVLVFLPAALRIILTRTADCERVVLAIALAVALQLSRSLLHPTHLAYHDEALHQNVLRHITSSGRLFTENPLLPVSAYYPGLEVVTAAAQQATGMPAFVAASLVLLVARLMLVVTLLALVVHLTGSVRIACGASLIYACNPQYIFFNSQFSYQSLALPLALLTAYLFASRRKDSAAGLLLPVLGAAAVALTHHLTSMLLLGALLTWLALDRWLHRRTPEQADTAGLAVLSGATAAFVVAAAVNPGNSVPRYLWSIVTSSSGDLARLLRGEQTKELFENSAGTGSPLWEQALMVYSVLGVLVALLVALPGARVWVRRRISLAVLLCLLALAYPAIPGGHLTRATAEVGDRAAGFVFLGVAFVVACWLASRHIRGPRGWGLAVATAGVFLGSVVLGAGPVAGQLPGPYLIAADARSMDSYNLATARWLATDVQAESRVYGDRVSGLLAAAVGGQYTVRHVSTDIDASRLLLDPSFTVGDVELVREAELSYVIADERLANGLPHQNVYIEYGEFGGEGRTEAVPPGALTKLSRVGRVSRVYDNGSVIVYDVRGLRDEN